MKNGYEDYRCFGSIDEELVAAAAAAELIILHTGRDFHCCLRSDLDCAPDLFQQPR